MNVCVEKTYHRLVWDHKNVQRILSQQYTKKKKSKWPINIKKYYISLPIEKHADLKCDTVSHIHLIG